MTNGMKWKKSCRKVTWERKEAFKQAKETGCTESAILPSCKYSKLSQMSTTTVMYTVLVYVDEWCQEATYFLDSHSPL